MKSMAKYSEATLFWKKKYELYSDRIVVNGQSPGSQNFEVTVPLIDINPNYVKVSVRSLVPWVALITAILTGFLSVILIYYFAISSNRLPGVLAIYSVLALIVTVATFKRVEYARFNSKDYRVVLLNIARSGPDIKEFDTFIETLVVTIDRAPISIQKDVID